MYQLDERNGPIHSIVREGTAMVTALAEDFRQVPGVQVHAIRDARLGSFDLPGCVLHEVRSYDEEQERLSTLASQSDWTVVIAPEFKHLLLDRCRLVEEVGGRLLSPSSRIVRLTSDKEETCRRWRAAGVRVPASCRLRRGEQPPPDFPFPAVLKPSDGAGSVGIERVDCPAEIARAAWPSATMRLENYCPGIAASVAVLGGPARYQFLAPCRQHLSPDHRFVYLGGELLRDIELRQRAKNLAAQAVSILEELNGYVGIDIVLGPKRNGSTDVAVEINPRITTSYVGLRAALRENLAQVMLDVAQGRCPNLSYYSHRVRFHSDGRVIRYEA